MTASWTPIKIDWQLGSARKSTSSLLDHVFWAATAKVDYQSVQNPGETALAKGTNTWAGATLSAMVFPFGKLESATPSLTFDLDAYQNLSTDEAAMLGAITLGFPLPESNRSSFEISYTKGTDYRTGEDIDRSFVGFAFEF